MTAHKLFVLVCILAFAVPSVGKSQIAIAKPSADGLVRLIAPTAPPPASQPRVFVVNIEDLKRSDSIDQKSNDRLTRAIPLDTLWPDGNGIVVLPAQNCENGVNKSLQRNPWEICRPVSAAGNGFKFLCGGVIIAGAANGVAILNGRIVKQGDELGVFEVAGVAPAGVILRKKSALFVIPRGCNVTVRFADI
jgi:hypothetical protein